MPKNRIETTTTPPYCSACFSQYSDLRYIDFDAFSDRGYGENGTKIAMDDLILCENCVREASELLGWEDVTKYKEALAYKDILLRREREKRKTAEDHAEAVSKALGSKFEGRQHTSGRPKGATKEALSAQR